MINEVLLGIFLSTLLGALVGIQREMKLQNEKIHDFAGFRTFTFISVLGFIVGFLSFNVIDDASLIVWSVFGFFILLTASYVSLSRKYRRYVSETSQIVAMIVFLMGIFVSVKLYYVSIVLGVLTTALLVMGNTFHGFAKRMSRSEIFATVKFLIVAVIVLPLLPNKNYGFLDIPFFSDFLLSYFSREFLQEFEIFNFYEIWLLVVFISSITYFGYIFMKLLGSKKGTILTGILGGIMSSTALTLSFSDKSKKLKSFVNPLACGVVLACSIMFFRVILEVAVVNPNLVSDLLFLSVIGIVGIVFAIYLNVRDNSSIGSQEIEYASPFSFAPAFKFGLFFIFIIFVSKLSSIYFGRGGIYFVSFFSGVTDVDAITLSLARLAADGSIKEFTAVLGIFIAAISNTLVKGGIVYAVGSKELSKKVLGIISLMILVGIFLVFFIHS